MTGSLMQELIKTLGPDLYRLNAFRLLAVSTDTSPRRLKRVIEKLQLDEKFAHQQASGGYLMELVPESKPEQGELLAGKTKLELAQEAVDRLNDPQRRLVEEFFWFWPEKSKNGSKDEGIQLANAGDFAAAGEIWVERSANDDKSGIALHNLAVLNHMAALDLEQKLDEGALGSDQQAHLENHWQKAYEDWTLLLDCDPFWKRMQKRVMELDDPRLPKSTGDEIRQFLPAAIPLIAAKLAVACVEKGDEKRAEKHIRRLDRIGLPDDELGKAKALAVEPIRERVNILVDSIDREAEEDPVHADKIVRRTSQSVRLAHDLLAADILFGKTHPTVIYLHDHIVHALNGCLVKFGNKTENWEEVARLLEQVKSLARSSAAKQKITEGLQQAKENAGSPFRWVVSGYYELPVSLLNELERARELFERRDLDNAIGKLESAYKQWQGNRAHIAKPLSVCLFLRAMQRYAEVSRQIEHAGQSIPSYQREQIRTNVTQIGRDLARAAEMDPKNQTIRERYRTIQEIGQKIGASIPRVSSSKYASSPPSATRSKPRTPRTSNRKSSGLSPLWMVLVFIAGIWIMAVGLRSCAGAISPSPPRPTSTPRVIKTPTRRPPTRVPTRTPQTFSGIPSSCIRWDRVGQAHVGDSICVYGIVQDVKPGNKVFTIEFSDQWGATKIQDFNSEWFGIRPGLCIEVYGKVRDNVSYLFISPELDNPRIYYYDSPSACR